MTISHIYKILCELLGEETTIDGIDVLTELDTVFEELARQYGDRSKKNLEYYYKNQYKV